VRDALAGLVVGVVALPLSMALAIASGISPEHGLYTAIVAGALVAVLGGSTTQVTGPTAAFVVVLAPIATRLGLAGLLLASVMAGIILLAMGAFRAGRLIEFIPHPVTTGFTAGIAVVIGTLQLKKFLGLRASQQSRALPRARGGPRPRGSHPAAHRAVYRGGDRRDRPHHGEHPQRRELSAGERLPFAVRPPGDAPPGPAPRLVTARLDGPRWAYRFNSRRDVCRLRSTDTSSYPRFLR